MSEIIAASRLLDGFLENKVTQNFGYVIKVGSDAGKFFEYQEDLCKYFREQTEDGDPHVSDDFLIEEAHMHGHIELMFYTDYRESWDLLMPLVEKFLQLGDVANCDDEEIESIKENIWKSVMGFHKTDCMWALVEGVELYNKYRQ